MTSIIHLPYVKVLFVKCISQDSPEKKNQRFVSTSISISISNLCIYFSIYWSVRFILRDWLAWLWRLQKPRPAVSWLETQESRCFSPSLKVEKSYVELHSQEGSLLFLSLLFCSGWDVDGGPTHPRKGLFSTLPPRPGASLHPAPMPPSPLIVFSATGVGAPKVPQRGLRTKEPGHCF